MKDNEISDKDIETATSYVKPLFNFCQKNRNKGQERKETSRITGRLKRALDFSSALVYNLLRK